jgi:UDP-2-acetamido-2,6-beta-L-arabino-hexul-4-ose reductase
MNHKRKILITGAGGFIGKNLLIRLQEQSNIKVLSFFRGDSNEMLSEMVANSDAIVHLAGENRSDDDSSFQKNNTELTLNLCNIIRTCGRNIPLIFASSIQAIQDNIYGRSKLAAENIIEDFVAETSNSAVIYRLPGVFGKWSKPNYNSVVATFCHNIALDIPLQINDPKTTLKIAFIDDVIEDFLHALNSPQLGLNRREINQIYSITLIDLANQITAFRNCRANLISELVGIGLTRALYSTYISYLPPEKFSYNLPQYKDQRGIFVEFLKTPSCGQFSFFTIHPGVTRGSHYHHTKTEKFLVIQGIVRMRFRHLITGELYDVKLSGDNPQVVDSIPGWAHEIINICDSDAIIMLWANEVFDQQHPDCIPCEV